MNPIPAIVLLQEAPPGGGLGFLLPMGIIFIIFYVLVIRPQTKKQKEHEAMLAGIEKGDEVITSGGLHGRVTGTTEDVLTVELAALKSGDRVRVKVQRSRIDSAKRADGKESKKGGEGS